MFGLPVELLELILFHLPAKDILRCQQVCRQWNELTRSSQELKANIFQVPSQSPPLKVSSQVSGGNKGNRYPIGVPNPLLIEHYIDTYYGDLHRKPNPNDLDLATATRHRIQRGLAENYLWLKHQYGELGKTEDGASWRDMFICQPPAKQVLCCVSPRTYSEDCPPRTVQRLLEGDVGVTMGMIHECVRELANELGTGVENTNVSCMAKDVLVLPERIIGCIEYGENREAKAEYEVRTEM